MSQSIMTNVARFSYRYYYAFGATTGRRDGSARD